ncbi:PhzF family phenazine biosynthesis protein [Pelagibius sp. Alg239-R121]|uniref:PhzF family phenazine biosynthesis protein n=1 Tax=Pelagibius sp. Alg239-R121 TaxID=2993448 RepID=UPI0024A62716|nr:PhzF family phenazine biosynthesis protein [Pelagibius sp. Alg239-R121]
MARGWTMHQVDAFTDRIFAGNPAAVLVLPDWPQAWPEDGLLCCIAEENNLAETAFVRRRGEVWDLRWFTPVAEAAFCGHATLATAHTLAEEFKLAGDFSFETQVGPIHVSRNGGSYRLDIPCFPPEALGAVPAPFEEIFPTGYIAAFRNFENLFVALPDEAAVRSFLPNLTLIAELHPLGLVITAPADATVRTDPARPYDFVSRYFAPGAGIPEDPVTGSTHATLVPYWSAKLGKNELKAFQASSRGGYLGCELSGARVLLTGQAVTYMKAELLL